MDPSDTLPTDDLSDQELSETEALDSAERPDEVVEVDAGDPVAPEQEAPTETAEAGEVVEESQPSAKLYAGKYKTAEDLEKAYREAQSWATREAMQRSKAERELLALRQREMQPQEVNEDALIDALANGRGAEAIQALAVRAVQTTAARQQQQQAEAERVRREARDHEWTALLEMDPSLRPLEQKIVELDFQRPDEPLPRLIAEAKRMEKAKGNGEQQAARAGAERAIKVMQEAAKPQVEASGRTTAAPKVVRLTRSELSIAKEFGVTPGEYAKWKRK